MAKKRLEEHQIAKLLRNGLTYTDIALYEGTYGNIKEQETAYTPAAQNTHFQAVADQFPQYYNPQDTLIANDPRMGYAKQGYNVGVTRGPATAYNQAIGDAFNKTYGAATQGDDGSYSLPAAYQSAYDSTQGSIFSDNPGKPVSSDIESSLRVKTPDPVKTEKPKLPEAYVTKLIENGYSYADW